MVRYVHELHELNTTNSFILNFREAQYAPILTHPSLMLIHYLKFLGSYANLVNSIMGAGLLGLPYAFANTGWFFSILFIILSTVYSIIGLQLLYFCSSVTSQPSSFFSITKVVNKNSVLLVDFSVLCMTFGASVAYLIIIGDLMPKSLSALNLDGGGWDARERWVLIGFAFAAPLGCFHNLDGEFNDN
jgi:amino acid permease